MRQILIVGIIAVACSTLQGQNIHVVKGSVLDQVALPGELATTSGNLSSYERGNIVADTYVEQKAVVFSAWENTLTVTPYVSANFVMDSAGYNWNNKISPSIGLEVNKRVPTGVITAGLGYMYENRFRNPQGFQPTGGRTDFLTAWFGWNDVTDTSNRFPGSAWTTIGHYSPVESGNLMERAHVQQGYVFKRIGSTALIPYAEATLAHDSHHFDWENIAILGSGLKLGIPTGRATYTEIGAGYLRETRLLSDRTASGIKVFVNVSYTWSLFGRKQP